MDGPLKRPLPALRVFIARPWRETGCSDPDPMVRIGALDMLENATGQSDLAARFAASLRSYRGRALHLHCLARGICQRSAGASRPKSHIQRPYSKI